MRIWSAGHGARTGEAFLDLLAAARIDTCVDIRTAPYSRRHPHFTGSALGPSLRKRGIGYEHRKALGGWRRSPTSSPHAALKEPGFRGYADHLSDPEFVEAYAWLRALATERRVAFMCSETLWWKCHRRILADRLVADGWEVLHLIKPSAEPEPHRLWDLARLTSDGRLVYDQGELALSRDV
ncbi:MAG: DUF488 domain-containing protein [Chloroflexota bacterium]|nr:DUF488 domain-containing protein [Chloroflexota bacterium]